MPMHMMGVNRPRAIACSFGQPEGLVDDFEGKSASVLAAVKASGANVRIPGERSAKMAAERAAADALPIPKRIWDSICKTAQEGLPPQ